MGVITKRTVHVGRKGYFVEQHNVLTVSLYLSYIVTSGLIGRCWSVVSDFLVF